MLASVLKIKMYNRREDLKLWSIKSVSVICQTQTIKLQGPGFPKQSDVFFSYGAGLKIKNQNMTFSSLPSITQKQKKKQILNCKLRRAWQIKWILAWWKQRWFYDDGLIFPVFPVVPAVQTSHFLL